MLRRLFDEEAPFYIGDVTEVERPYAQKTPYVGRLADGKTLGFQAFFLAQPYRGRAIPFAFSVYSERTLEEEATSRNLEQWKLIGQVKALIGEKPLLLNRELGHLGFFETMEDEGIKYVVRLKMGNHRKVVDAEGKEFWLGVKRGEKRLWRRVRYLGKVRGNVAAYFGKEFREPIYVFSNLEPEEALALYRHFSALPAEDED